MYWWHRAAIHCIITEFLLSFSDCDVILKFLCSWQSFLDEQYIYIYLLKWIRSVVHKMHLQKKNPECHLQTLLWLSIVEWGWSGYDEEKNIISLSSSSCSISSKHASMNSPSQYSSSTLKINKLTVISIRT